MQCVCVVIRDARFVLSSRCARGGGDAWHICIFHISAHAHVDARNIYRYPAFSYFLSLFRILRALYFPCWLLEYVICCVNYVTDGLQMLIDTLPCISHTRFSVLTNVFSMNDIQRSTYLLTYVFSLFRIFAPILVGCLSVSYVVSVTHVTDGLPMLILIPCHASHTRDLAF